MELYEPLRMMYARVQALDPVNVSKIIGYLLLQDDAEQEMIQLALASDALLFSLVDKAKHRLGLCTQSPSWPLHNVNRHPKLVPPPAPHNQEVSSFPTSGVFPNDHFYPETFAFLSRSRLKQQQQQQQQQQVLVDEYELPDHGSPNSSSGSSSSSSHHVWKSCVYYSRGNCKHGNGCRFLHTPGTEARSSDEKLESEFHELLRSRKSPVAVSSIPQLYLEKFDRPLQLQEYESSLTSLVSQLKNVHLIDSPTEGPALVLVDGSNSSSRQIYLTFPAESSFNEDDVNAHFSAYGPVQDVRIPYQQKRMFGFVTFVLSETVKTILAQGNPHYICQARVLVKPYRDKVKHIDKKNVEVRLQNGSSTNRRNQSLLAFNLHQQKLSGVEPTFHDTQASNYLFHQ